MTKRPAQTKTIRTTVGRMPVSVTPASLVPRKRVAVPAQRVRTVTGLARPKRGGSVGL